MTEVLKFPTLVAWQKGLNKQRRPRSGSNLFAIIMTSILGIPALETDILFEDRKRKVFEILKHDMSKELKGLPCIRQ